MPLNRMGIVATKNLFIYIICNTLYIQNICIIYNTYITYIYIKASLIVLVKCFSKSDTRIQMGLFKHNSEGVGVSFITLSSYPDFYYSCQICPMNSVPLILRATSAKQLVITETILLKMYKYSEKKLTIII